MRTFDGPDCGINGCAREVGHLGDHRRDPAIEGLDIDAELAAGYIDMVRSLGRMFSVEAIAKALHEQMREAAATWDEPVLEGTCDEDGHLEEARDLHRLLTGSR
jgi:hypothetical protein